MTNRTPYGKLPPGIKNVWEEKREHHSTVHDYHFFQPDIFNIEDNTKLIIYCGQDARYFDKEKVKQWLIIKDSYTENAKNILEYNNINLEDKDLCVINCRGGEYRGISSLFLSDNYCHYAIHRMQDLNEKMKFVVITDDIEYFSKIFNLPVYHFGIAEDYYILNNAKNLILSNSGSGLGWAWAGAVGRA